jgi:hypothetical protein
MTLTAPFFMWAAVAVSLATLGLHLLAWRRPPESPLPTARFAPERPIRMVSRAVRPSDLGLLALRVLLVMLIGLALAGPVLTPRREGTARVVVVDRSRSAGAGPQVTNAARNVFRAGDALVLFDSAAHEIVAPTADSIETPGASVTGALSPALIVAARAAHRLAHYHDSVTIVVVSPFTVDEIDAATASIRRTWPGPLRFVRAGTPPNDTRGPSRYEVRSGAGDPVSVAAALVGPVVGGDRVRIVRDAMTAEDTAWARDGNSVIWWPTAPPTTWSRRPAVDTSFAVSTLGAGGATVVAAFARVSSPPVGRAVARWSDGETAITEEPLGSGCVRSVGVSVSPAGDLALTPGFRRFLERVATPCGAAARTPAIPDSVLVRVLPATLATGAAVTSPAPTEAPNRTPVAWMLGLAMAAAVAELVVRRGGTHAAA